MRIRALVLAAALALAPLGVQAADLVVWWEKGQYAQEDEAVREIVAAFEQQTGKQVELVLVDVEEKLLADLGAAIQAGRRTPDFIYTVVGIPQLERWAYEGRLVDLSDAVGHFSDLFDRDALERSTLLDGSTGQRRLYLLPLGLASHHVHVWKSLLEQTCSTLADIPKEWDAFWSFWCDRVQPAARRALGRDDIWAIGLPMSVTSVDTATQVLQFVRAYEANYVTRDGQLVIDDPEVRRRLIKAIDSYTAIFRKGCTPPDSLTWGTYDNNAQFLAQTIMMTMNSTLSIPNALKPERPEDYYENAVTVEWPEGAYGQPLPLETSPNSAAVFKDGGHIAVAKEFVSFLIGEGWLAHYLNFSAERMLPAMPKLLDAPFWLDPGDPHRMRSAMQLLSQPRSYEYVTVSGNWRHAEAQYVWPEAVHRVAADGIAPEQAVDEAIGRIKQILAE